MTHRALLLAVLLLGLLPAMAAAQAALAPDQRKFLDLVNREREAAGLQKFLWDPHLAESARAHALLLVKHEELSHQFPGEPELTSRVAATGLRFNAAAENVAFAPTVESSHAGLMKSPHHRENILNPDYNSIGIAIVPGGGELYVAQNFAHALPVYTEAQFRDGVVATFNRLRKAERLDQLEIENDKRLHDAACSGEPNPEVLIRKLQGVSDLVAFTVSSPDKLPDGMKRSARDRKLKRMIIGVCFKPGHEHGFASFWVVAAFYPGVGD
ncbi:MAG TPA: CAP domain-containing protein [Candidatus Saccharimonadales bacterium]|nr:CAP domain-containing protein [Candidatus Saccharimonadales bacterium]